MRPAPANTEEPERLPTITDVEHRVRDLLHDFSVHTSSPATDLALRHLEQFFDNGGKRIRPRMVLTGWQAAHADCEPEQAICTAAAFEIIHNGILIQDDILDRSDYRRGKPTVRAALANEGQPRATADDLAMMIGWLAQTLGLRMILRAHLTQTQTAAVLPMLCEYQERCAAGQMLDTLGAETVSGAREIARWKNYYTFAPLLAGAALCAPTRELTDALTRYAEPMVEATQYRNDIDGVFAPGGDGVSDDLREGKTTVLALETLRRASPRDKAAFAGFLGNTALTAADTAAAQHIVVDSGALNAVLTRIETLTAQACAAVDAVAIPTPARQELDMWVGWSRTGIIGGAR